MIVVDTSVLISMLRGEENRETRALRRIEDEDEPFGIPAVCAQEVLQGARDEHQWRLLSSYLRTQNLLTPSDPVQAHIDAARMFYLCRRRGITIRSTIDCLVAQIVIECEGYLLHRDRDFEKLKSVCSLKMVA